MNPEDLRNEQETFWRIALVLELESRYEGCSCHELGADKENIMHRPLNGDIGEEKKIVEAEPVETPSTVPAEPVPA